MTRTRRRAGGAVVAIALVASLSGCAASDPGRDGLAPPSSATETATVVSFCQGVAAGHPAGSTVTIRAVRGSTVLAEASTTVTGRVSFPVTPGPVTVTVDGTPAMTTTAGTTGRVSGSAGSGCPSA